MPPEHAHAMTSRPLSTRAIVDAAVELTLRDSLEDLSMRKLARHLGRAPMSLYRHVDDIDALRRKVVEELVGAVEIVDHGDDWRRTLVDAAHRLRNVFAADPGILSVVMRSGMSTPNMLASLDTLIGALRRAGLDEAETAQALSALMGFIFGSAVMRRSLEEVFPDVDSDAAVHGAFVDGLVRASGGQHPHVEAIAPAWVVMDRDEPFAFALERLLDGFERLGRG